MLNRKVNISEVSSFYQEMKRTTQSIRESIEEVETNIDQIMHMDTFQGKAAEAAKEYFKILHGSLLQAFAGVFEQLETNLAKHIQDFQENIDTSNKALIQDSYLEAQEDDILHTYNQLENVSTEVKHIISSVADLTTAFAPSINQVQNSNEASIQVMQKLSDKLDAFASGHKRDQMEMEGALQEVRSLMSKVEKATSKTSSASTDFQTKLPMIKKYMVEAKENTYFNRMLLSQEERSRRSILESREFPNLTKSEGLQKYEKKSSLEAFLEPVTKSANSFKEIGLSIYGELETRNEKKHDSTYDYVNYLTMGLPDGAVNFYHGMDARYQAMKKDFNGSTFLNYLSIGTTEMATRAVNPEDPLSAEHWMDSIGLAGILAGGGAVGTTLRNSSRTFANSTQGNYEIYLGKNQEQNLSHPVLNNIRTGSALKKTDGQHGFNDIIDNYVKYADEFELVGGDGINRKLYQIEGGLKYYDYKDIYNKDLRIKERKETVIDNKGIFEWIVDPNKGITHRRFIPNGTITGYPNQRP
ncbi:T7SS effector LXG polymorphic toxin [Gracilibacillus saliphilus]|uniref:T7SS effector LXG polymorphic toxin n=1 Tax=Gracilibacillus saliphilus TaxID=543890 RepID=UPI0013D5891A|nr:T7SS effector LXG polymorphic toxin [Gracilibacillus saliphilus]